VAEAGFAGYSRTAPVVEPGETARERVGVEEPGATRTPTPRTPPPPTTRISYNPATMTRAPHPSLVVPVLMLALCCLLAGVSVSFSEGTSPNAAKLVKEGQDLYEKGNLGEALLKFEEAVKAGAQDGEMFYQMGYAYKAVRADAQASRDAMVKAAPLLEKTLDTAKRPAPFYYLSAIYLNDLADTSKGTAVAQRGIAMAEKGAFGTPKDGESLFQIGRLYSLTGQPDKAVAWYEKADAALAHDKTPNRQYRVSTAEQLAGYYLNKQDFDKAGTWMAKLVTIDPTRQKERISAGLSFLKAGKYAEAVDVLNGFTDDDLATEANYLQRIIRRYVELGKPPLPEGAAGMDGKALQEALIKSAGKVGEIRKKEDDAQKSEPPAELPYKWVTSKTGTKAKVYPPRVYPPADWQPKDPNNPTPDEVEYMMGNPVVPGKPAPPPSAERVAAEKEFFALLIETVRRGQTLREMAIAQGLTSVIFR